MIEQLRRSAKDESGAIAARVFTSDISFQAEIRRVFSRRLGWESYNSEKTRVLASHRTRLHVR